MKKVKLKVKILAGAAIATTVVTAGHIYTTNAMHKRNLTGDSIQLNVEKQDRDTIKIYLSSFSDLAKSLQLSVKIEEGNVQFVDDSIKWLVNNNDDSLIADYKIDNSKKTLDLFLVSKEPINSDGGVIELCEIDVSKNESIIDKIFKSKDGSYKVVPNVVDGEAYSYVRYSTNKRIGGQNILNSNENKLTINDDPIIKLKENPYIMDNKIVILKGTVFNISDYVEAFDADGNEIKDIEYSGKIDNKKAGSYNITCTATDSLGDKATIETTVIVEDFTSANITKPVIYGADDSIEIVIGESFNLEDGIRAVDYMGRELAVKISGDYDTETTGTYTLVYTASDRFGNTTTVERTLIVSEKNNDSGNGGGVNPPSDSDNEQDKLPSDITDIINDKVINIVSGSGTISKPLVVEPKEESSIDEFAKFLGDLCKFEIKSGLVKEDDTYKILTLRLSPKSAKEQSISLYSDNDNSEDKYITIRINKSKTEFINLLDNFIEQNNFEISKDDNDSNNTEKPDDTNGSGNTGSSSGSGNSGNSNGSGNSNEVKYEIPSNLQGVIDLSSINVIEGNGTSESPLVIEIKNMSSNEFTGFLKKLEKFNIKIDKIEENNDFKIVNLKLTEKYSAFNLLRLFRNAEDTYLNIKVNKKDTDILNALNKFIIDQSSSSEVKEEEKVESVQKPTEDKNEFIEESNSNNNTNDSHNNSTNNNITSVDSSVITINNNNYSSNSEVIENNSSDEYTDVLEELSYNDENKSEELTDINENNEDLSNKYSLNNDEPLDEGFNQYPKKNIFAVSSAIVAVVVAMISWTIHLRKKRKK